MRQPRRKMQREGAARPAVPDSWVHIFCVLFRPSVPACGTACKPPSSTNNDTLTLMNIRDLPVLALAAALPFFTLSCREKRTAEKIGEKIDIGAEKVGEKLEEGAKKVEDVVKDALDSRPNEPARDAAERAADQ